MNPQHQQDGIVSVENLKTLARGLWYLKKRDGFGMATFLTLSDEARLGTSYADDEATLREARQKYLEKKVKPCGTAACAVGWAPHFGIGDLATTRRVSGEIDWIEYSHNCLIKVPEFMEDVEMDEEGHLEKVWSWCFGGNWDDVDNTPKGAARRIIWLLKHGLPKDADEQSSGHADLCYTSIGLKDLRGIK